MRMRCYQAQRSCLVFRRQLRPNGWCADWMPARNRCARSPETAIAGFRGYHDGIALELGSRKAPVHYQQLGVQPTPVPIRASGAA